MPQPDVPPPGGFRTSTGYTISAAQRQYIGAAITRGLGPTATYEAMVGTPVRIRKQALLDAYGELAGARAPVSRLNRAERSYIPTPGDYHQLTGAQRTYDRYRVVGSLDLTAFGAERVFWGFSKARRPESLAQHAARIFIKLAKVIQSFQRANPDAPIDVSADDVSFYSFESFSSSLEGGL